MSATKLKSVASFSQVMPFQEIVTVTQKEQPQYQLESSFENHKKIVQAEEGIDQFSPQRRHSFTSYHKDVKTADSKKRQFSPIIEAVDKQITPIDQTLLLDSNHLAGQPLAGHTNGLVVAGGFTQGSGGSQGIGEKRNEENRGERQALRQTKSLILNDGFKPDFTKLRWQHVKKFIEKIKVFSSSIKFSQCSKSQLEIINDRAFNFETFYHSNKFMNEKPSIWETILYRYENSSFYKFLDINEDTSLVITPNSIPNRIWDTIQFVFLLIYIIYLPVRLSFIDSKDDDHSVYFYLFEVVPNILQIINMFLEFNTGFYSHGIVIRDRKRIFFNYVQKKFMYDILVNVCWLASLKEDSSEWLKAVGMVRLVNFVYLISEIEETFSIREIFGSYFDLFKLGGFIFISAHFCGCCWYALAVYEESIGVDVTWLTKDVLNYDPNSQASAAMRAYISSFYWSIVTMCTVGYGDIGPTTYIERVFVIAMVLCSSFIFGFSMNQIGEILSNLRQSNEEFKAKMTKLSLYMKKRKLNKTMQSRVSQYYQYLHFEDKENNEAGKQLIEDLPPFLRDEVKKEISKSMFIKKNMISSNFSSQLNSSLYEIIEEYRYGAEEYLFKAGGIPEKLFFVIKGEVSMILQDRVSVTKFKKGQFIGAMEFFSDRLYDLSAITTEFTQIASIPKKAFLELVQKRQDDRETFGWIRDSIGLYKNTSMLDMKCESCMKFGHQFQDCSLIQFHQNRHKLIYEYNSVKQLTRTKQPRPTVKFHTLLNLSDVQGSVQVYAEDENAEVIANVDEDEEINGIIGLVRQGEEDEGGEEDKEFSNENLSGNRTGQYAQNNNNNNTPARVRKSVLEEENNTNRHRGRQAVLQQGQNHLMVPRKSRMQVGGVTSGQTSAAVHNRNHTTQFLHTNSNNNNLSGYYYQDSHANNLESSFDEYGIHGEQQQANQVNDLCQDTLSGLDSMREFNRYFKHNNYSNAIKLANIANKRNVTYQSLLTKQKSRHRSAVLERKQTRKKGTYLKMQTRHIQDNVTFMS